MKIALHVPCYVNELNPQIAKNTLLILRHFKLHVTVPKNQTCCGQPFINSGTPTTLPNRFNEIFKNYDYIVSPSSSCVYTIRSQNLEVSKKTFELCEFLYDVLKIRDIAKNYPKKIAFHHSCHSLRGLCEAAPSELNIPYFDKIQSLLGCELTKASKDECCGFGGVFSLKEGYISYIMGRDKLNDLLSQNPDIISGVDYSCLMHLDSIAKKDGDNIQIKHISEVIMECLDESLL
ncbi:MAG: (Fe-S)-binding protein [Epsilonproteobacteria bacterium]|nr:(Fe-S)-binding protein [Campylobacterota bacterium]